MTTYDIVQTIFNFFLMFYIYWFLDALFDQSDKRQSKWFWGLYLIYPIFTSTAYFLLNYPIFNMLANVAAFFIISFQYHSSMKKRIISICIIYFIFMAADSAGAAITNYMGHSIFDTGTYQNIAGLAFCKILEFMVSLFMHHGKNIKRNVQIPTSLWAAIVCVPALSIIVMMILLHYGNINQAQAIVVVSSLFGINISTFFLYDALMGSFRNQLQMTVLEDEREYYYNQCQYMQKSEEELRAFRHDMQNQLDMLYALIRQDSSENVLQCASKIAERLQETDLICKTENIVLDSILNLKLTQAKWNGIQVTCKCSVPKDLQLDASDLMVILGNLLDNAITAAESVKENPFLSVSIAYDKGMLFFHIKNSYQGELLEFDGHLRTTKKNREHHGYGIRNVQKVLEQYHGMMEFSHADGIFEVHIALYCKVGES